MIAPSSFFADPTASFAADVEKPNFANILRFFEKNRVKKKKIAIFFF